MEVQNLKSSRYKCCCCKENIVILLHKYGNWEEQLRFKRIPIQKFKWEYRIPIHFAICWKRTKNLTFQFAAGTILQLQNFFVQTYISQLLFKYFFQSSTIHITTKMKCEKSYKWSQMQKRTNKIFVSCYQIIKI